MKKSILLIVAAAALFSVTTVQAQKGGKKFSAGFGIESGLILGDDAMKEAFGAEFGLSARFSVKAGPGYATFTPGAMLVFPKSLKISEEEESVDLKVGSHIPLKLGYKYIIAEKFFVMAEAGYARYTFYSTNGDSDDVLKQKAGGFTYAPSVGANLGKFEIGLRYEASALKLKDSDSKVKPSMLGLRIGFNF
ncbi:MAG: outer membrane beta-barrel protein [Chitinophagaceae bacterium]|nr:outer membrane beta-barrel protein [Chitinophagaceae bacterium]